MSTTPISLDSSALLGFYQSRNAAGTAAALVAKAAAKAPTPPWDVTTTNKPVQASELVRQALGGRRFVDEDGAQLDVKGASGDYRKLFAAYSALNRLSALAERAGAKGVGDLEVTQLSRAFARGAKEAQGYLSGLYLDALRVVQGATTGKATGAAFSTGRPAYVTQPLAAGSRTEAAGAFEGDIQFDMEVKPLNGPALTVNFDLDEMGSTPRSISEVLLYMNGKLEDAAVSTRFAIDRVAGVPVTKTVNGKTVTLSTPPDRFGLKLTPGTGEGVSLSAPVTAPAIYVGQSVGKADAKATTDPTARQLLKFQADGISGIVPDPVARPGDANRSDERVSLTGLGKDVGAIRAQQVGPDGSLYVLAEATGEAAGQALKGTRDVTLSKYDSAGNLIYTRTLGAAAEASGYSLAVSADGKVAVAGAVKGQLNSGEINIDSAKSDSFVALYDAAGDEVWTYRNGARDDDEARAVAFGADGSVYVAGRSKSAMPGATAAGGWDGYLQVLGTNAQGKAVQTAITSFGGTGDEGVSGLAVSGGQVVVAGVDAGHGTLRSFELSGGAPTLTATRDLGSLGGGTIAGVAFDGGEIVVAGATRSTLDAGTETVAFHGGSDAFAARLGADLTPGKIAYWGGDGDESVSAMTVSGGRVYLAGASTTGAASGVTTGFVTRLDVAAGAVEWSQSWSGKDGVVAPTALAVSETGASALDRLGLPNGRIDFGASSRVVSQTSARPGDQFYVQTDGGVRKAVVIEAGDTFATLAKKITRALGFQGSAAVKRDVIGTAADDTDILGNTSRLVVTSRDKDTRITLSAGPAGRDALESLGLAEGEVRTLKTGVTESELVKAGEPRTYGLGLSSDLALTSKAEIKRAADQLASALSVIRGAYRDLKAAAEPKTSSTGQAPAYLTAQIANYQAALARLGG